MKVEMLNLYIQQDEAMVVEVEIYLKVAGVACEVMLVLKEEREELYPYKTKEVVVVVEEEWI